MVIFPGCKINIGLNIIDKRTDGYHNIESVFYPLDFSDILEIVPNDRFSITLSGLKINGDPSNNLVVKAYLLLKEHYNILPVKIHLHKIVPMGAGLGGGSADGAATLVVLNKIFDLNLKTTELEQLADRLGSDCAFFIRNKPAFVQGKGEIISPFDFSLKGKYIQLISPQIHVSTQAAFNGISPKKSGTNLKGLDVLRLNSWKNEVTNDFEKTIFPIHPEIELIKDRLYAHGAIYASMTGTGSSVFGIFNEKPNQMETDYSQWISEL